VALLCERRHIWEMEKSSQRSSPRPRRSRRRISAAAGIAEKVHPEQSIENLEFALHLRGTLPETIRSYDLEVLNAGLRFFFADLRAARRDFGDNQRHGALTAVGALIRFIAIFEAPFAELLHVPALVLQEALFGLEDNIVKPMLKPIKKRGRSRSSMAREALKGHVAGTVQRLLQAGTSTPNAQRLVAKELVALKLKSERGSGDVTATTVRHWCDEVAEDLSRSGGAAVVYDRMFAEDEVRRFEALPSDQARRQLALASLVAFVLEVRPGTQNPVIPQI
jgi:hypothetical protein